MWLVWVLLAIAILAALVVGTLRMQVRAAAGVSFHDLRRFCSEFNPRLAQHMRAYGGGDRTQLEGALRAFLPVAREMAARQAQPLADDVLRALIVSSLAAQRLAPRADAEAAVDAVLVAERPAA